MRFALALLVSSPALAAGVVINHSGRLLDSQDKPVTGQHHLKITLFKGPLAADSVFDDAWDISPSDGVYAVYVGDDSDGVHKPLPAAAFDGSDRFLGVSVDG